MTGGGPGDRDEAPLLPEQTGDDTDSGWGERGASSDDERLWREVPPHHGS